MPRKRPSTAFLVALLLLGAAPAPSGEWITVTRGLEGFSVKMPGQPERTVDEMGTRYVYSAAEHTPRALVVGIGWRKTEVVWDAEQLLNRNVEGFVKPFGGDMKVVSRTLRDYPMASNDVESLKPATKTKGYPGLEVKLQRSDGSKGMLRVYVDKPRLREFVMSYVVGPEAKYSDEDARRFFDSFTLLY